jgi:molecular chaperone DnaK
MGRTIGIDLGTTNTVVAVLQDGRPRVLEDEKGYKVLPSVVSWKGEGRYIVGPAAKNLILTAPDKTVYAIKRLMGRRYDSPEVQDARRKMAFDIEAGPDGYCQVVVGDTLMTPVEVSAVILQVARQIAERAIEEEVEEAVITVPAYFNHAQRAATMDAARLAGLHCERLLNEPTAAALAYGYRKDYERTICIYDLGGGTFDVSVLHLSHGVYEILSTTGDTYLGGNDFDERVVEYLADRFRDREGIDPRDDRTALQRLREAAERAKCELSFSDKSTVFIPQLMGGKNLEIAVSRQTIESLCEDLVQRTVAVTQKFITDAGLKLSDIEDVILVGGQTRMPRVREVISGLFAREPNRSVHPEEVVAIGAAVHAESLVSPELNPTLLIDVTPFDLGIDSAGGYFTPIIDRNSKIPAARTRTFTTVVDNQEQVRITVRQGESPRAAENEFLGEFLLLGLRASPRLEPKFDVSFRIDASGMLHVSATDRTTGGRQQITVRNYADSAANPTLPDGSGVGARPAHLDDALAKNGKSRAFDMANDPRKKGKKKSGGGLFGRFRKKSNAKTNAVTPRESTERPKIEIGAKEESGEGGVSPRIDMPAPTLADEPIALEAEAMQSLGDAFDADDENEAVLLDEFDDTGGPATFGMAGSANKESPTPDADDLLDPYAGGGLDDAIGGAEADSGLDDPIGADPLPEITPEPKPTPAPKPAPRRTSAPIRRKKRRRKPARLKIAYRQADAFVDEYRENLKRGNVFIPTAKPLSEGRECRFEITVPGLNSPVILKGDVTWSSRDTEGSVSESGMRIEYRLDGGVRDKIEALMSELLV